MKNRTYFIFVLLSLIWGSNFIFMRMAGQFISPGQTVFLRLVCGFIPVFIYACMKGVLLKAHLRYFHHFLVMAILAGALYYWAFAAGTTLLLSGISGVLSGSIAIFSFISAAIFLKEERITLTKSTGVIIGFIGIVLIAKPWLALSEQAVSIEGVLYMLLGSLCSGLSYVYAKKYLTDINIPSLALTTYQIGLAMLIMAAVTDFQNIWMITANIPAFLGLIIGLGLLGTGVAYLSYYYLVKQLGALKASSVTYVAPVIALAIGYLFADEPIGYIEVISMFCIFGGVYLIQNDSRLISIKRPEPAK